MSNESYAFPWEREAMRGEPMPEGLPLMDQMAYTALRNIYGAYRQKALSREQAAREKRLLRQEYEAAKERTAFSDRLTRKHIRVLKGTELAASACRKDPTPENALRLCAVIAGLEKMEGLD